MRKLISFTIVIVVLCSIFMPVTAASYNDSLGINESEYDMESYYYALWDNYNHNMHGLLWEYVCGEQYYVYTQTVNQIGYDGWIDFASRLTEEQLTKERYTEILVNLMAMMDYNTTELINDQVEADSLKTFGDYAMDVGDIVVQTFSLDAAFGANVTEPMKKIATALNLTWDGTEVLVDTVNKFQDIDRAVHQYMHHAEFLSAIIRNSTDEALEAAAANLLNIVDLTFFNKINALTEASDNITKFLEQTVFFDTIVLEYMVADASILGLSDSDIETIDLLKSAYEYLGTLPLAADLGTFAADMLLGVSDVMNRYNEMCALTEIRNALITQMGSYRSSISGVENIQEIDKLCHLMKNLIYINFRGEYCAHEMLTQDSQAYSLAIKINGQAQTVDKVFEHAKENTCIFVDTVEYYIFPTLKFYQLEDSDGNFATETYSHLKYPISEEDCYIIYKNYFGYDMKADNSIEVVVDRYGQGDEEVLYFSIYRFNENYGGYSLQGTFDVYVNTGVCIRDDIVFQADDYYFPQGTELTYLVSEMVSYDMSKPEGSQVTHSSYTYNDFGKIESETQNYTDWYYHTDKDEYEYISHVLRNTYIYDERGFCSSIISYLDDQIQGELTVTCDAEGRILKQEVFIDEYYNAFTWVYDDNGNVLEECEIEEGIEISRDVRKYNENNDLVIQEFYHEGDLFSLVSYTYDSNGYLSKITNMNRDGDIRSYGEVICNEDGKVIQITFFNYDNSPSGTFTANTYNDAGYLTESCQYKNGEIQSRQTYTYQILDIPQV